MNLTPTRPRSRTGSRIGSRVGVVALTTAAVLAAGRDAAAQSSFSIDAGTASIRYDSAPGWSAATLTPALRVERPRFSLGAASTLALLDGFGWSGQGGVDGSISRPISRSFQAELAALAEGGRHEGFYQSTGQMLTQARAHWLTRTRGAWLGGGVGRAWNAETRPVLAVGDLGAWIRRGGVTLTASVVSRTQFKEAVGFHYEYRPAIDTSDARTLDTVRVEDLGRSAFGDATAQLHYVRGVLELDLSLGHRFDRGTDDGGLWGGASAVIWLARQQIAVVGSAGSYPGDVAQRLPRSRYATLALRLVPWGPLRAPSSPSPTGAAPFEVRDGGAGMRTIVMRVPSASRVELMGDFTDWQPLALARGTDGEWTVTLPITAGTHRINVRVNGGEWSAPPGLTSAADEFLGAVGILIVK